MRKNSGQALVEFIIILPVLLLILLGIIDFGNIIYKKYGLESSLDMVEKLYLDDKETELAKYVSKEDIQVEYEYDDNFTKIMLNKDVDIITPGLNKILNDPYKISVERYIYNE